MNELGKIERISNLREIWKHEATDFSKWLSQDENLSLLSETVGISIELEELESSVGSFNVDLFASEEGTNRKIIIENQLEDTDHDHLGKIITYASGKDAEVIIWIVKRARDEHRQAVEWLNHHTDENVGFFLIEIEVWKINNSLPAPKFNVVESPNNWSKTIKASKGLTSTKKLQLEFWQAFNDYAFEKVEFKKEFSQRKAQPHSWYDLSVGTTNYRLALSVNTQKNTLGTEIYIPDNKDIFQSFKNHKELIESKLNMKLNWRESGKACRIVATSKGNIKGSNESWNKFFDWFCELSLKLKKIIKNIEVQNKVGS